MATNHFMPENLAAHAPVPRVLQRLGYRIAWKDLGRIFGQADVVTAPTPRAVELLQRSRRADRRVPGLLRDRRRPLPPRPRARRPQRAVRGAHGPGEAGRRADQGVRRAAPIPGRARPHRRRPASAGRGPRWSRSSASPTASGSTGSCPRRSCVAAYARAAVFCMPGIAELQSLVTLEAMASGTPVIAADAMALPHLVRPGRNGWLYRPGDVRRAHHPPHRPPRRRGTAQADGRGQPRARGRARHRRHARPLRGDLPARRSRRTGVTLRRAA